MIGLQRRVRRITNEIEPRSRRPLVIELVEGGRLVRIREKGRRTCYTVTYHQIWVQGARNAALAIKQAKEAKRLAKKGSR